MTTLEKIQNKVDELCKRCDEHDSAKLSVCNAFSYGWDRDEWNYRYDILATIRQRGYNAFMSVNHGVTDIDITKKLNLK